MKKFVVTVVSAMLFLGTFSPMSSAQATGWCGLAAGNGNGARLVSRSVCGAADEMSAKLFAIASCVKAGGVDCAGIGAVSVQVGWTAVAVFCGREHKPISAGSERGLASALEMAVRKASPFGYKASDCTVDQWFLAR
jgi:hypothetical protein